MATAIPKYLYRCLPQRMEVLRPVTNESGTENTGEECLYAYTEKDKAVATALAWILNERYKVANFQYLGGKLIIVLGKNSPMLNHAMLCRITLFIYTIIPQRSDNWLPMFNPRVAETEEWKTQATIRSIRGVHLVTLFDWLVGKTVEFKRS